MDEFNLFLAYYPWLLSHGVNILGKVKNVLRSRAQADELAAGALHS